MSYARCPLCGAINYWEALHDLEQQYVKHYPGKTMPLVPGKCFECWQHLKEGDRLIVRKLLLDGPHLVKPGDRGTLLSIISSFDDQFLYEFESDTGEKAYLVRAELRKMRYDEK